jgi:hypothetical protein
MQSGSLKEVIAAYLRDGQSVAPERFTHLIPFAARHEILRQKQRDLHLIRMTPDLIYDQLIGAGCARELTFAWGGNPGVSSLQLLRDGAEHEWPRPVVRAATGWPLAIVDNIDVGPTPTANELCILRDLHKRTEIAHANDALRSREMPWPSLNQVDA